MRRKLLRISAMILAVYMALTGSITAFAGEQAKEEKGEIIRQKEERTTEKEAEDKKAEEEKVEEKRRKKRKQKKRKQKKKEPKKRTQKIKMRGKKRESRRKLFILGLTTVMFLKG